MTPSLSIDDLSDHGFADPKLRGESLAVPFWLRLAGNPALVVSTDKTHVIVGKFPGMMRAALAAPSVTNRDYRKPFIVGVLDVLRSRDVFKVFDGVVPFIPVFMIYVHSLLLRADKRPSDKSMKSDRGEAAFCARVSSYYASIRIIFLSSKRPGENPIACVGKNISTAIDAPKMFKAGNWRKLVCHSTLVEMARRDGVWQAATRRFFGSYPSQTLEYSYSGFSIQYKVD